ncbi:MAG: GreA/GreB family elongation factor [Actinomycetota bacterium]
MEQPSDIVVSAATLERMQQELTELETSGREEMGNRLRKARELGDLSENADYHAAREAQGLMEARIRTLKHMIANAVVREGPAEAEEAQLGVIVSILDKESGDRDDYLLASSTEEKAPGIRTITTGSPLGSALVGRKAGETVTVAAPAGQFEVEILEIRPA